MAETLTNRIIALSEYHMSPAQISYQIGCHPAYVRVVAQRHNLKLPRSKYGAILTADAEYMRKRRAAELTE